MSGTLFIVSTPIGHLDDMTERAKGVLAQVDVIAAEDTRNTGQLLNSLGLRKPMLSYHDHNEQVRTDQLLARLLEGENVALVSDAGTPLVSDPGYRIVRACHEKLVKVVPVPGASALLSALVVSGLPSDRFTFEGFLPAKGKARADALVGVLANNATSIVYEAPSRVLNLLELINDMAGGNRELALCRELTKRFETVLSGPVEQVLKQVAEDSNQQRGEIVVVISPAPAQQADEQPLKELGALLLKELPASRAAKVLAGWSGRKRADMYQLLESL